MLSRRLLLCGAAGAGVLALSGCDAVAGLASAPAPLASSPDPSLPAHAALIGVRRRLDAAAAADLTDAQAGLIAWARRLSDEQHAATSLAVPAPWSPAPASPAPDAASALAALADALAGAGAAFARHALDATTARPLTWASMAAWCAATSAELPEPRANREPARGVLLPAAQTAQEAAQDALDAASAALYGLQVAAGYAGLDAGERGHFAERLAFWAQLRDRLDAQARQDALALAPAPPWFDVRRPADRTDAYALAARAQANALPALGGGLAHAHPGSRGTLIEALAGVAVDVPRWSGLLERWPGLPRT